MTIASLDPPEIRARLKTLTLLSLLVRVLVAVLIITSTYLLTLFDSSPQLVLDNTVPPWISSLLRWDAFHFALVAEQGHVYEHTWAFFPALPFIMRVSGDILSRLGLSPPGITARLFGGALLAAACDPTRTLYRLSLHHLRSPSAAFLATALSLFSSSPATLRFAPYTEPFFTYCSYQGMWACACARWAAAAGWFTLAGAFRSNGMFLAGFLVWGMVVAPWLAGQHARNVLTPARILYCAMLVVITLCPFVYHNYTGYVAFCTDATRPGWCEGVFPSIYSHVQRAYWDVGFLRYWTLSNVPNFVLAMPVLANVYAFGGIYLARLPQMYPALFSWWTSQKTGAKRKVNTNATDSDPPTHFFAPSLFPHVLHALALTLLLTFNAHVQIALRVLSSLPVVYWAAAWMVVERPQWGRAWVTWSVVWGAVSCVLWATFLPPA